MRQCDSPLGVPLADQALVWRIAPVLLAKAINLHGPAALIVPWLGLLVMLTQCAWLVRRRTGDDRLAALTTILIGTTSATLTVTGWLGLNDAWYASALIAVAFQPSLVVLAAASLVGPWVDERFVLALPLAIYVRAVALKPNVNLQQLVAIPAVGLIVYGVSRYLNLFHLSTTSTGGFIHYVLSSFQQWLPWTSLGWFMGLRAVWVLVVVGAGGECRRADFRPALWPALLVAAPLIAITLLASDTGRTTTMLLPLVLLGVERLLALRGAEVTQRILLLLLIANLLMPAMHVTYQSGDIINMFPVELARWLKQH